MNTNESGKRDLPLAPEVEESAPAVVAAPDPQADDADAAIRAALQSDGTVMICNLGHVKDDALGLRRYNLRTRFPDGGFGPMENTRAHIPIPFATPEQPAFTFRFDVARRLLRNFGATRGRGVRGGGGRAGPDCGLRIYNAERYDTVIKLRADMARKANANPPEGKVEIGVPIDIPPEELAIMGEGGGSARLGPHYVYRGKGALGGGRTF